MAETEVSEEARIDLAAASRNFWAFVLNLVLQRIGWVFKLETVIIPSFVASLTDSSAVRGLLPSIARIGQSIPQVVVAHWASRLPRKSPAFLLVSLGLMLPWALLAVLIALRLPDAELLLLFLLLYSIHWVAYGATLVLTGTLQGKLIPVRQRGALLAVSGFAGCVIAVLIAYLLLPRWMGQGNSNYALVFGMTAFCFTLSALTVLWFRESPDTSRHPRERLSAFALNSLAMLRNDAAFGKLVIVVALFYVALLLFPHYTVYGQKALKVQEREFVHLIAAQNLVNAFGSVLFGSLADWRGNRLALRFIIGLSGGVPLLAVGFAHLPPDLGRSLYWIVFALLGLHAVSQRIIQNYVLELAPQERHAQYLGTMNLFQVLPLLFSPVLGWCIDRFSFEAVFIVCALLIWLGGILTLHLPEPRHRRP